jgi:Bacterial TSP3 repeat
MPLRLLKLFAAVISLALTTTTCTLPETRKTITNSYRLARFRLEQCHRMGADEIERERMELADRLSAETEAMVAAERWRAAQGSLTHLEETLARLLERSKTWDPDGDGLSTYAEFVLYGTSWSDPDTDGDGYLDGTEVLVYETDPLDPCAVPIGVQPEKARTRPCPCLERVQSSAPP